MSMCGYNSKIKYPIISLLSYPVCSVTDPIQYDNPEPIELQNMHVQLNRNLLRDKLNE